MKLLYFDEFKGGIVKSSYGEEWEYKSDGSISNHDSQIYYQWDGEFFSPKKKENTEKREEDEEESYGAGHWNGVWIGIE